MASHDEVRLRVPAHPEFLRLARVTAAALASRLGFTFDEVDDLRLAIDELCHGLIGSTGRPDATVELVYAMTADGLTVNGSVSDGGNQHGGNQHGEDRPERATKVHGEQAAKPGVPRALSELSEVILSALVDEHSFTADDSNASFHLLKRRDLVQASPQSKPPGAR